MIDLDKAREIAQKEFSEYPVAEIIDIGNRWAFGFDSGDPPVPGIPYICVSKEKGDVEAMTIPPFENLDILEKGTVIYSKD